MCPGSSAPAPLRAVLSQSRTSTPVSLRLFLLRLNGVFAISSACQCDTGNLSEFHSNGVFALFFSPPCPSLVYLSHLVSPFLCSFGLSASVFLIRCVSFFSLLFRLLFFLVFSWSFSPALFSPFVLGLRSLPFSFFFPSSLFHVFRCGRRCPAQGLRFLSSLLFSFAFSVFPAFSLSWW